MSREHGRHEKPNAINRPRWVIPLAITLAAILLGGSGVLITSRLLSPPTAASESGLDFRNCPTPSTVQVAAAPQIVTVVEKAAAKAGAGSCSRITVTREKPADTANTIIAGEGPQGWIPDSSLWMDEVNARGAAKVTSGGSLATSPLVVAVPNRLNLTKADWTVLLDGSTPVQLADPGENMSSRLAMIAARAALQDAGQGTFNSALIRLSRIPAASDEQLLDRLRANPQQAVAFPVQEAVFHAYTAAHRDTKAQIVVPGGATTRFDYPILTRADAPPAAKQALNALRTVLLSADLRRQVRQVGLRNSANELVPDAAGTPKQPPVYVAAPKGAGSADLVRDWKAVQGDVRMLVVMDVSGSMRFAAGDGTRMDLAQRSALLALKSFPNSSSVGLWAFASRRGGTSRDWVPLVPIRPLAQKVKTVTQRQALEAGFAEAASTAGGGTGLYDTIAASYREVLGGYDPTKVNTLVLITDGHNEDRQGLSLTQLLADLAKQANPKRPVSVALVAITKDADAAALRQISNKIGGRLYRAVQPDQIQTVLVDALRTRQV